MPYRENDKPNPTARFWAHAILRGVGAAGLLFVLANGLLRGCESCDERMVADCQLITDRAARRYEEVRDECRDSGRVWHENTETVACPGFWRGDDRPTFVRRDGECWDREERP